MGYAKGDDVGFSLDASDPDHECRGPANPEVAYGSLMIYDDDNGKARITIGDDVKCGPNALVIEQARQRP